MIPTELNGSLILYKRIVRPYFLKHHGSVDNVLSKAKESGKKQKINYYSINIQFLAQKLLEKSE